MYISCVVDKLPEFENKYDQHITLMYDTRNRDFGLPDLESGQAEIIGYEYLGEANDTLALILKSEYLEEYHKKLIRLGYRHSFKELLLHTSIKYDILEPTKPFYEIIANTLVGKRINFHSVTKEKIKD